MSDGDSKDGIENSNSTGTEAFYTLAQISEMRKQIEEKQKQLKERDDLLYAKFNEEHARIRQVAKDLTDCDIELSITKPVGLSSDVEQALILVAKTGRDNFRRNY